MYVPTVHLFLASLVMSRKNIRLEWFGRGNIDDIETMSLKRAFIKIIKMWDFIGISLKKTNYANSKVQSGNL